jgi:D-methionine transport system ATP-binding protein
VDSLEKAELFKERRKMGMIFQNFHLFSSRNVEKNVAYPLEIVKMNKNEIKSRITELLDLVGIPEKRFSRIKELSGGQKQRVAIARALAVNPNILFCDEATSALDPQTTRSILALLKTLHEKFHFTMIVVTHQMDVIRSICSEVAVLDSGKIIEKGSVAGVFGSPKERITRELVLELAGGV